MGGNVTDVVREVLYFRLRLAGHREPWRFATEDPFYEFEPARSLLPSLKRPAPITTQSKTSRLEMLRQDGFGGFAKISQVTVNLISPRRTIAPVANR